MPLTDALSLSIDSLIVGAALAPLVCTASSRLAAAALFGAADAFASLLGTVIVVPLQGLLVAAPALPALYGAYLVAVAILAGRGLRATSGTGTPWNLPALAVLSVVAVALSVDNLVAPAAASGAAVVAMGATSAALVLVGFALGEPVFRGLSATRRVGWIGVGLVVTACSAVLS